MLSNRKSMDKRFVDYIFLAGLPTDFQINPDKQDENELFKGVDDELNNIEGLNSEKKNVTDKEQAQIVREIDQTSSNFTPKIKCSKTFSSDMFRSKSNKSSSYARTRTLVSRSFVADDEGSTKLLDALFESIKASIIKFDQDRCERKSKLFKNFDEEFVKSDSMLREVVNVDNNDESLTTLSTKLFKNFDETLVKNDSLKSSSNVDESKVQEGLDTNRRSYQNVVPQQPSSKQNDVCFDTLLHPLRQKFAPKLLSKYPENDYPEEGAFPEYVPMFCFPNDIMLRESNECPSTTFHGFVMTQEDGSQRHGACLTTYEPIPEDLFEELNEQKNIWREANMSKSEIEYADHLLDKIRTERRRIETTRAKIMLQGIDADSKELEEIKKEREDAEDKLVLYNELLQPIKLGVLDKNSLWIPKCIGIVSHLPWHDVLKDWLCAVAMPMIEDLKESNDPINSLVPLERHIVNLVHEIPLPPPGKLQVAFSVNDMTFFCARPALNQIPIMKDFSLYPLFRSLSIQNIVTLFEVALTEGKILLISSYPDMLYLVAHSITYLIYPLYWQGVFIPVLPARLMACLQAPVPYIMGIERQYKGVDLLPEDACIVDLDKNTILLANSPIQIPSRQRKKLIKSLEQYAPLHTQCNIPLGVPKFIQEAYPNGKFIPISNKSKIHEKTDSGTVGSIIGMPARAIPFAPSMNSSFNPENGLMKSDGTQIDQALHLAPIPEINDILIDNSSHNSVNSGTSSGASEFFINNCNNEFNTTINTHNKSMRQTMGNMAGGGNHNVQHATVQRRFSNFVSPSSNHVDKADSVKSLDKFGKKTKQRFSSITGGARNSIITLRNKALSRNSSASLNGNVFNRNGMSRGNDIRPHSTFNNDSVISQPTSPDSIMCSDSLFDDVQSTMFSTNSDISSLKKFSEKDYILKEGHFMVLSPSDNEANDQKSGVWMMEGLACRICRNSLSVNSVYKCDCCSVMIHEECLNDIAYPCIPACFDEPKILDAFLRVFASLLSNYRYFLLNNDDNTRDSGIGDIFEDGFGVAGDSNELFKKDLFLKSVEKSSKPFLSNLLDSQSFSQFIAERVMKKGDDIDFGIKHFDEVIKAKLNRSKLKISKESTSFLNDSSFEVSQTVRAIKPNEEGLDELGFEGYVRLPDFFDPELISNPRAIHNGWANGFGKGWR
ncbi:4979_t:CDS:10 [Funneliformis geosporum]|uniref:19339_t:CDS:1 n=1 Tax=Funneliformis geosporum TaxID=1117311 RepID=A0A9W4SJP1_9GLOM|nr:4979_t:CDS:10 [Funneliformis geosporum]CAI2171556.1 19339_t:CDS:10 [Funneliformis geosporum]